MKLQLKDYWYVCQKIDINKDICGRNMMIKFIKDVYPVLKNCKEVRKLPYELLEEGKETEFFGKFYEATKNIRTKFSSATIDKVDDKFIVKVLYGPEIPDEMFYCFPISFLPALKKENESLYAFIFECIMVLGYYGVDIINNKFFDMEWEIENIRENYEEEEDNELFEVEAKRFFEYKDTIFKHKVKYTPESRIIRLYNSIVFDKNNKEHRLRIKTFNLMNAICKIIKNRTSLESIEEWCNDAHCDLNKIEYEEDPFPDGTPLFLSDLFYISWFSGKNYTESLGQMYGEIAGNYGIIDYVMSRQCNDAKEYAKNIKLYKKIFGTAIEDFATVFLVGMELSEEFY